MYPSSNRVQSGPFGEISGAGLSRVSPVVKKVTPTACGLSFAIVIPRETRRAVGSPDEHQARGLFPLPRAYF
jgi:hypothetical protein